VESTNSICQTVTANHKSYSGLSEAGTNEKVGLSQRFLSEITKVTKMTPFTSCCDDTLQPSNQTMHTLVVLKNRQCGTMPEYAVNSSAGVIAKIRQFSPAET